MFIGTSHYPQMKGLRASPPFFEILPTVWLDDVVVGPSDANDRSNWREMIRGNWIDSNDDSEVMG